MWENLFHMFEPLIKHNHLFMVIMLFLDNELTSRCYFFSQCIICQIVDAIIPSFRWQMSRILLETWDLRGQQHIAHSFKMSHMRDFHQCNSFISLVSSWNLKFSDRVEATFDLSLEDRRRSKMRLKCLSNWDYFLRLEIFSLGFNEIRGHLLGFKLWELICDWFHAFDIG